MAPTPSVSSGCSKSVRRGRRTPHARARALPRLVRNILETRVIGFGLIGIFACISFWFFLPKPPLLDGIPFSQCVRDRNGQLLEITLTPDQKFRTWTPLSEISPHLVQATLRYEDKYYRQHPGINPIALARSVYHVVFPSEGRTGGSTITMQLARLRFHLRTRTFSGKATQMLRALELERHYSKSEILEAYLNLAPYGGNIEGAGAAAEIYFAQGTFETHRT